MGELIEASDRFKKSNKRQMYYQAQIERRVEDEINDRVERIKVLIRRIQYIERILKGKS